MTFLTSFWSTLGHQKAPKNDPQNQHFVFRNVVRKTTCVMPSTFRKNPSFLSLVDLENRVKTYNYRQKPHVRLFHCESLPDTQKLPKYTQKGTPKTTKMSKNRSPKVVVFCHWFWCHFGAENVPKWGPKWSPNPAWWHPWAPMWCPRWRRHAQNDPRGHFGVQNEFKMGQTWAQHWSNNKPT